MTRPVLQRSWQINKTSKHETEAAKPEGSRLRGNKNKSQPHWLLSTILTNSNTKPTSSRVCMLTGTTMAHSSALETSSLNTVVLRKGQHLEHTPARLLA